MSEGGRSRSSLSSIASDQNENWYDRSIHASLSSPGSASSHSTKSPFRATPTISDMSEIRCRHISRTEIDISRKREIINSFEETINDMHCDGLGNTEQCIQDMLKKRELEEELEQLEDNLLKMGNCSHIDCQKHHPALTNTIVAEKQVRSTPPKDNEFKIVPPRKVAKIKKPTAVPEITTANKFKDLMELDNESTISENEETKIQIPAINLKIDANYNLTLQEIIKLYPDTQNKLVKGFISIQATSNDRRNSIIDYLKNNNKEFFLSEAHADRPLKVVIKDLTANQNKEELKQILEDLNFKIIRINQLRNYRLKTYHPIFLIEVAKTKNHLNIYNLKTIKHLQIKVETYRKKNRATICFKCNGFFHSARNCQLKTRCLKCEENHETKNCTITTKIENPKCINCKEYGHLAFWQGCPMFPKIKNHKEKPTYAQKLKHNLNETRKNPPTINLNPPNNDNLKLDLMNAHELFNALKIIKETLNEFPNIIEISKKLLNCTDKQEKLKLLLNLFN
ncbi:hypothetical protein AVEN_152118-1 [Araneus ventricosus]|uniref:CCHC-type domain-containing protein n=1 Tax=Araneus ventricosus TaxID=182803 RepID=A0A4Y2T3C6_ARAVE|nr:hypothetical protein AVEN_152118-1 [Araneus ventricosus]